jgi:hypothetical protein
MRPQVRSLRGSSFLMAVDPFTALSISAPTIAGSFSRAHPGEASASWMRFPESSDWEKGFPNQGVFPNRR